MKKLERIIDLKFQKLENEQMNSIIGGRPWHWTSVQMSTDLGQSGTWTKDTEGHWDGGGSTGGM